jgi:hypothetical protein
MSNAQKKIRTNKKKKPRPKMILFSVVSYFNPMKNIKTKAAFTEAIKKATGAANTDPCITLWKR